MREPATAATRAEVLLNIQSFIEANLGDPDLDPERIARASFISTRYLHKLFEAEGTSVCRWIRTSRLERCRRDLLDPELDHETILAIASRWGLPGPQQFSRLFRSAYGCSPSELRREARRAGPRLTARRAARAVTPGHLKATGISVSFGGVHAVVDVDLEVGEGQLVGLIGPNGAGKTTFIDAISGFVRSRGRVELDGGDLTRLAPHVRARRGLARTWQSIELFDDLTSARTCWSPRTGRRSGGRSRDVSTRRARPRPRSAPALELLGLEDARRPPAERALQGQRKLAGIARALVAKPRSSASTSRPPASTPARARSSAGGCARSSTAASRCSSSTTTWASCSGSATRSSCSSSAR